MLASEVVKMRRKDRELTGRENIEAVLQSCKVCRLAMISNGKPYVIPLNYGYVWDGSGLTMYFHTGLKGKKIDALNADPHVCFEIDIEEGLLSGGDIACRFSYAFSSVIGEGSVQFAQNNDEKRHGFDIIMRHQTGRDGWEYSDAHLSVVNVFWVHADSFEASRRLPK